MIVVEVGKVGMFMDFPSATRYRSPVRLATSYSYPTPKNRALISTFLTIKTSRSPVQKLIKLVELS